MHPTLTTLLAITLLHFATPVPAVEWKSDTRLEALFDAHQLDGTFVLLDEDGASVIAHNRPRATTRLVPASTFKIPNTLIGLASGAVNSVDEVLPYGGKPQPFPQWEQDMPLRRAIVVSNVPVYQELARRIGAERMQEELQRLDYGNAAIGDAVDQFWLSGPLAISALEQAQFLRRLALGELPYPADVQQAVRDIVRIESGDDWVLYAKTGWAGAGDTADAVALGWWVGWIEHAGAVRAFALNVDMPNGQADADRRVPLGRAALSALGLPLPLAAAK
jgi:beta-lactamase class D